MAQKTPLAVELVPSLGATTPINSAEVAIARLFDAKPATREERELASVTRAQLVEMALTGGKTKLGQQELVSLVLHTNGQFQRGADHMFALQARPKVNDAHEYVSAQFTGACLQALNRYLYGSMENGAAAIGETIATPIEARQQKRSVLDVLLKSTFLDGW